MFHHRYHQYQGRLRVEEYHMMQQTDQQKPPLFDKGLLL